MSAYGYLASVYDELTGDVPYLEFADYYEAHMLSQPKKPHTVLDLACGTGTLTCILAERGYETIAVDASGEMLSLAMEKAAGLENCIAPLLLCQNLAQLDLYGTVDAAISCLDSMNYLPPEELEELFRRLALFIEPGGFLMFDVHSPERLRSLDGELSMDETDSILCIWSADFDCEKNALIYSMDIFQSEGRLWRRDFEEHIEYAHSIDFLKSSLRDAGFSDIAVHTDGPQNELGRIFISAVNRKDQ